MKKIVLSLALLTTTTAFADVMKPIPENERIAQLLQGKREITNLVDFEKLGLNEGKTSLDLWSGSYWPQYQGSLGVRYRDPSFMTLMKDKEQYGKFKELREKTPLYTFNGKENLLSPAEKYDLVVGDHSMTLTKYAWELGEKNEKFGKVPTWRGVCDGWSSAAQMMPRPTKSVVLTTAQGTPITFFPEDIKALGSLLYARAQDNVIFLGKRCYPVVGVFSGGCDATNPGTLHKAIANRVGNLKKTFNADISTSSEVWNYPVKSYKFTYYNVLSDVESTDFKKVYELFEKKQRFAKPGRRHDRTYAIVGVKAEVVFADMREANLLETDGITEDKDLVKTYMYDLELDRNFTILGGEWESSGPDFIWAPNDKTYPISDGEKGRKPVTAAEVTKAAQVSSKEGQPLSVIVEKLFELSK
jgi:hypothetical protein